MRTLLVSLLAFGTAHAVAAEPLKLDNVFDLKEVAFVKQLGTATVSGKAFLKLASGAYRDCAGFNIELLPVSAYSSERIGKTYGNNSQGQILLEQNPPKFTPDAPEYHEMLLKGACDERGDFTFTKVPAGDYYVMAFITGGAAMKRISVSAGSNQVVLLKN